MQPQRISILGVGLLGGSIGLAARSRLKGCKVVGYGHKRATLDAAIGLGAIDEGYEDLSRAVRGADLVILCTPVGLFRRLLGEMAPLLSAGTLVTDVGSTKRSIVEAAGKLLPAGVHFVGSHPMAGSEKRGVEFARADLYEGALCILTPTERTDAGALKSMESFWGMLGMRTCRVSPEEHDRRLAEVSHLPHALAAALVMMQEEGSTALAGKGFHDMTRIAGGDAGLWRDILMDNRDNVRASIRALRERLDGLDALLEKEDSEGVKAWLHHAAERRL
ncbi:MAG: prephenate dehydrogenase [Phycisphaerales bacterium]|nr:prephenate dehydrogenase [Phycisphaerales bacterium]MDB5357313.1 prephenate dehydrogenase [Phycisphaerales bacterium]